MSPDESVTIVDVAQVVAALAGILIAALVAVMPFARRPRLALLEDSERVHSRVETTDRGGVPHVRLLAANRRRRRAAKGTRVVVEGYRAREGGEFVSLAHPSLGWPSAPEAAQTGTVTIFAGGFRPVGLGRLIRVQLDPGGRILRPHVSSSHGEPVFGFPHYAREAEAKGWYLWLDLGLDILDDRDKLPPTHDGYVIVLTIGADDGAARRFEVDIDWIGDPGLSPANVLASALEHLAVREL